MVIIRGDESEVQRRKWRAPRALCFMVATAWQPTRGPVSVVSLRQVVGGVAAARRWWIPYGGGLPGAVRSASFGSLLTQGHVWSSRQLMSVDGSVSAASSASAEFVV